MGGGGVGLKIKVPALYSVVFGMSRCVDEFYTVNMSLCFLWYYFLFKSKRYPQYTSSQMIGIFSVLFHLLLLFTVHIVYKISHQTWRFLYSQHMFRVKKGRKFCDQLWAVSCCWLTDRSFFFSRDFCVGTTLSCQLNISVLPRPSILP
jgi:FlaA1/EpsC-like NDP-sugar epimerase